MKNEKLRIIIKNPKLGLLFLILNFSFSIFHFSCSPSPSSPILATINGEKVTVDDFEKYRGLEQWKFEKINPSKTKILDDFLKGRLLLQEAKKRALDATDEEVEKNVQEFKGSYTKAEDFEELLAAKGWTLKDFKEGRSDEIKMKKLVEQITSEQAGLKEEDLKKYYKTHLKEFWHPSQVHARQIVTDSREKALSIKEMLDKGTSFEETAGKYSLSPDRKKGGDLGWFERGVMPKEFDQVCLALRVKEMSPVIQTPYGFHIFQLLEKRPAGQFGFEEVKNKIQSTLTGEKGREIFQKWYEDLRSKAEVKVYAEIFNKVR